VGQPSYVGASGAPVFQMGDPLSETSFTVMMMEWTSGMIVLVYDFASQIRLN
jgi:hypothetical protein